ncbi:hypothetical protein [Pseudomonas frederiksbergensis]|uniref:hypothetical protein n=1 Tax=Pseudomonas frederiksbergensis TaxID=104087 RepID=UPI003D1DDCDC
MKEKDWKLYSAIRPWAHERLCTRIMDEVERTVLDKSKAPYERFEEVEKLMKAGKKELYWAFDSVNHSRSNADLQFEGLCARGLITAQELEGFSEQTQLDIKRLMARMAERSIEDLDAE